MITLNNVLNLFKDIADRHRQINDYEVSQDFNIDADDAPIYPILVVNSIDVINDISFDTLRGVYDSDVTGWKCTLEIETPNNRSYCSAPID